MTAAAVADLLDARRTGSGRWMARCPAHDDREPSLSITTGRDGRVLVHCFAGCAVPAILAALGLAWPDISAMPAQAAMRRTARKAYAQERCERRIAHGRACDLVLRWQAVVDAVGDKLARRPEDAELASAFQRACDRLHEAEALCD